MDSKDPIRDTSAERRTAKSAKEERYVRPTIAGWLAPTMLGPWISVYSAVSVYAAFGPEGRFLGRWAMWAMGMLAGSLVAAMYVLVLVIADVLLLALRQRMLPTGRRAWAMALGSPLLLGASYVVFAPHGFYKYGPWAIAAALLVPMIVSAFSVRVFAGTKIAKASTF